MLEHDFSRYASRSRARAYKTSLLCASTRLDDYKLLPHRGGVLSVRPLVQSTVTKYYEGQGAASRRRARKMATDIASTNRAGRLLSSKAAPAYMSAFLVAPVAGDLRRDSDWLTSALHGDTDENSPHLPRPAAAATATARSLPARQAVPTPFPKRPTATRDNPTNLPAGMPPDLAREITRRISNARTWSELAVIPGEHGGMGALNDIHLSAALTRLAKVDLAAPAPQRGGNQDGDSLPAGVRQTRSSPASYQQQPAPQGPPGNALPSEFLSRGPSGLRGSVVSLPQLPLPPQAGPAHLAPFLSRSTPGVGPRLPPQPPAQLQLSAPPVAGTARGDPTSPGAPGGAGGNAGMPQALSTVGSRSLQPGAMQPLGRNASPSQQLFAGRAGAACTPAITSPEGLYLELLEELASRCSDAHATSAAETRPAAVCADVGQGDDTSRHSNRMPPAGDARLPLLSPPARVLANGTWAAMRLLLRLGPRLPCRYHVVGQQPAGHRVHTPGSPACGCPVPAPSTADKAAATPVAAAAQAIAGGYRRAGAALRVLLACAVAAGPSLEPQHVSNLLYSVAQLAIRAPDVLDALPPAAEAGAGGKGQEPESAAAGVVGGRAEGRAQVHQLVRGLLAASESKLGDFGAQALSNSLYAVALLDISLPRSWLGAWLAAAAGQLRLADPQHVSNMLWALVRLRCHPGDDWVTGALQAAAFKAPAFTVEGLCVTLWSLAKLGFVADQPAKEQALLPLLSGLRAAAGQCQGQDVANGMWAVAQLRLLVAAASLSAPQPQLDPSADVQALPTPPTTEHPEPASPPATSPVLAALRTAGWALLGASSRHLHSYSPQQLANTAWATAALGLPPPADWVAQFWPAAQLALPAMRTEELVATAMAAARLRLQPPQQWMAAVLDLTAHAMQQQEQQQGQGQQQGNAGGVSGVGSDGDPDVGSAAPRPATHAPTALCQIVVTDRLLASLLWCVAAWRVRVPAAWTAQVLGCMEARAARGSLDPKALAMALQSMSRMGLRPDGLVAGWTRRVAEGAVAGMRGTAGGGSEGRAARMVLWSLARLRCPVCDDAVGYLALLAAEVNGEQPHASAVDVSPGGHARTAAKPNAARTASQLHVRDAAAADDEGEVSGAGSARNVCVSLWALAVVADCPRKEVMQELSRRAALVLPRATPSEFVTIARAFAVLGFRPGRRFWAVFEERLVHLTASLSEDQVVLLTSCCAKLRWKLAGVGRALQVR